MNWFQGLFTSERGNGINCSGSSDKPISEQTTFTGVKYGNDKQFFVGQKVYCIYYNEYPEDYMREAYKRSIRSKLIDAPFKPPKSGIIEGDAGIHPYWLSGRKDKMEQYLFVRFKEYNLPKPIPISCMEDLTEHIQHSERFLKDGEKHLGERGFSYSAHERLTEQLEEAKRFNA